MESILSYIYYGNTSFENQEDLLQLLEISIYFKLNLLKEIIQEKISNSINYSNFFQLFFQNRNLKSNEIEIKCFEFLNQNFSQIQKDENLFSLTKEEIIRFIQFKQEKKEIFELDFFQFLSEWMKKSNKKLRGKKYRHKMNVKKRLSHSFFSLFDKDSISKKVFNKLKESDFILPKSFLLQKMKQKTKFYKNFPQFSDSEIEDIRYAKKLKKWINDNEFFSKMKKGYSAKKDGFNCQNWHKAVDNKGKTLVIIKTTDNYIFGGFTQIGFTTDKSKWSKILQKENFDYITDQNAFIFSLRNDKGNRKPEKFSIKKNDTKYAIYYDYFNHGPAFGGNAGSGDFILDSNLQSGCSKFGNSYKLPNKANFQSKDQSNSYLAGSYDKWVVDELETFYLKFSKLIFFFSIISIYSN
ncbi:pep-cterm sorting domain-containing protein [Anaeramoeba ignava]|uniref:Pep-cterm sorting domain-containing protein n=1 Tax=Anaeramoeba ignava TaxID=1746090 RepID=A0A9Q0R7F8_ANAIG|nr:pep-cterm sorting domain-containing protein [Anaeramoeba ignava]